VNFSAVFKFVSNKNIIHYDKLQVELPRDQSELPRKKKTNITIVQKFNGEGVKVHKTIMQ
jgi:hypothetical protein